MIWLLRQLKPDFETIADFRRDNRGAFRAVSRQFVRLRRELDLYGRELTAVDGTRIKAVSNRDRSFTRSILKKDRYRQRMWDWRLVCTLTEIPSQESFTQCDCQVAHYHCLSVKSGSAPPPISSTALVNC